MSDRIASRNTHSSGLEEVPSKAPGSQPTMPANGMNWRPISTIYYYVEKSAAACSMSTR